MIIRILLILIGLLLLGLYIKPLISLGIFNAGNAFGYLAAGAFILLGIFFNPVEAYVKQLWQSGGGKALVCGVCAVIILFCGVFFVTLGTVISHSQLTAEDNATVIILGCKIRGDVPSVTLKARCNAASDYMKNNPQAKAVATGGQGRDENLSEGECIYNLLTENGVEPARILIEDKSVNTDENIKNAATIIERNGLSKDVAIATSDYHEYRASLICKKYGLSAKSVPARTSKLYKPTYFTREVFGVWEQWMKS